ncbi:GH1 family beta-glucosidase [Bacillus pinisoli]|uniref:GH1 family beta-glucosidase n=1 Tax=Bacillus pinisoli TaxID=2901866 RepID=UPI001FF228CA|nr:GH1 family beta-glucosidase [Bacillus pinisoli]
MRTFPKDFVWGAATAAFQIEGAAKEDGRGESIWDRFCRTPGKVANGDTGDVACNHYHLYQEDVQLLKDLNVDSYRFSISWPRIFPTETMTPNQQGLNFYKKLVNTLLEQGITPMATLYHWDLPQWLQDKGGWTNREIVQYFKQFAETMFRELGDTVKYWITHNEPWVVSYLGYGNGVHAPGHQDLQSFLSASHHILLSHGETVSLFREVGPTDGKIGITLNMATAYPADETAASMIAAQSWDGFLNRWFADPVFKGAYPNDMLDLYSDITNFSFIHDGDLKIISQPTDFLGINYYSIAYVKPSTEGEFHFLKAETVSSGKPVTAMDWEIHPQGLTDLLIRLHNDYNGIPIYITENGAAFDDTVDENGEIHDDLRLSYIEQHLEACLVAMESGVNLRGYYVWSFLDNFEWAFGYDKRFGVVYVDYETQKRTPKKSALWYRDMINTNKTKNSVSL